MQPMRATGFRLPDDILNKLLMEATKQRRSRSEVLRLILMDHFKSVERKKK